MQKEYDTQFSRKAKQKRNNIIFIIFLVMVAAITFCLGYFIFAPMQVEGLSMFPTLDDGQLIFVQRALYSLDYDDIIIFIRPNENYKCIKRVLGMGGDLIQIKNGRFYRNGSVVITENIDDFYMDDYSEFTLAEDEIFVLGDYRKISLDSREYGPVKTGNIIGKLWI